MAELNAHLGSLGMDKIDNTLDGRDVVIGPDASIGERDAATGLDSSGLSNDQTSTTDGEGTQVGQVEVVHEAVLGGVHAHGGDNDAIGEGQVLDGVRTEEGGALLDVVANVGAGGDLVGDMEGLLLKLGFSGGGVGDGAVGGLDDGGGLDGDGNDSGDHGCNCVCRFVVV